MTDSEISPSELRFRFQLGKTLPATINIHNPNAQRMGFKVKTTTPKKYCVKPSSGAVEAHGSAIIQVTMQASKEMPADLNNCKDKFLIQTMLLGPGEEVNPDAFKKDNKAVKDTKLRVILEGPPAPPSPVPEAAEDEEGSVKELKTSVSASPNEATFTAAPSVPLAVQSSADKLAAGSFTASYDKLRAEVERLERENKELRSKVDRLQSQPRTPSAAGQPPSSQAVAVAAEKRLALVQIVLVAIIAFLIGHYF